MFTDRRKFIKSLGVLGLAGIAGFPGLLSASNSEGAKVHIVRRGDNLTHLARDNGVSVADLRRWNNLSSDRIMVGQRLIVGFSEYHVHVVQPGESLSVIARRYGTSVAALREANGLTGDRILVGQELRIPGTSPENQFRYIEEVVRVTRNLNFDRNRWRNIVAHHSGIARGNARSYDRNHREQRRWPNGLAYHFVIGNGIDSGDGQVEVGGRWVNQIEGGHVRRREVNLNGIGICLVGNFQETRPSRKQLAALNELVLFLKGNATANNVHFTVHRLVDRNHTVCPGRHFPVTALMNRYNA
ncbi:MAG: LysM peptidoglycan-binding domain-containing protein [Opitutales bacterium]|nr:LysM peptidoglycan-binding domain-containing protein [Opitutales bacterium]